MLDMNSYLTYSQKVIERKDDIVGIFIPSLSCFQRNWQFGSCFLRRESTFPFERSCRL